LKSILYILFVLLYMGRGNSLTAQVYSKARIITIENGLSDNSVNCFYKDRTGFMWIGTRHGLNQYNGHSFRVFKPSTGNSITNEFINSIAEESNGTIWVATGMDMDSQILLFGISPLARIVCFGSLPMYLLSAVIIQRLKILLITTGQDLPGPCRH
jgi:hypothetical protein